LRKESRPLPKDRLVVTYEYGWIESVDEDNSRAYENALSNTMWLDTNQSVSCQVIVSFSLDEKQEVS
jgi:hypothetical protein